MNSASAHAISPVSPEDRLLVEAVRAYERISGEDLHDATAVEAACRAGGSIEQRLVCRARALPVMERLEGALRHIRGVMTMVLVGAMILVAGAGAGTARAVLGAGRDEPVNFYLAFLGILLVQTLVLAIWLGVMVFGSHLPTTGSLGALIVGVGRRISRRVCHDPVHLAGMEALARAKGLRWGLSGISHGVWLCFNLGALGVLLILLSTRHYTFGWETTILSERSYTPLTQWIAIVPERAGFVVPSEEQIRGSQWTGHAMGGNGEEASGAWSGLLVGCIVMYGVAPRMFFLVVCLGMRRRAIRRAGLNLDHPDFVRLRKRLLPERRSLGIVGEDSGAGDEDDGALAWGEGDQGDGSGWRESGTGSFALVGFEVEGSAGGWPPKIAGVPGDDLGFVSTREERSKVIQTIETRGEGVRCVLVICSLTNTPDRGALAFVRQLRSAAGSRAGVCLWFTGGQRLRDRSVGKAVQQRIEDWRALGKRAGVPEGDILELDLDHFGEAGAEALRNFLGMGFQAGEELGNRKIEAAFATIVEHAEGWRGTPDHGERLKLHRAIARHYREGVEGWRGLFHLPDLKAKEIVPSLELSADRIIHLLPSRFRLKPRWLAAGAAAGAFGCVAAAALISPVAIASLPLWTGFGAALSTVLHAGRGVGTGDSEGEGVSDYREVVDGAALFGLVLELQGRGESAITRILDQVVEDEGSPPLSTPEQVRQELDELRHRLDLALEAES